nr:hypothetical protein CFP56_65036 [Quercus suber]
MVPYTKVEESFNVQASRFLFVCLLRQCTIFSIIGIIWTMCLGCIYFGDSIYISDEFATLAIALWSYCRFLLMSSLDIICCYFLALLA